MTEILRVRVKAAMKLWTDNECEGAEPEQQHESACGSCAKGVWPLGYDPRLHL
jgi:hypothetical protein